MYNIWLLADRILRHLRRIHHSVHPQYGYDVIRRERVNEHDIYKKKVVITLTGLAVRALAVEAAHPIDTGGAVETGGSGAIVNVHRTVLSGPAVHANAIVRSQRVGASRAVVANARSHGAFVHVHLTRIARPLDRARARVAVHAVHARAAV